jgi:hypothetical protein
MDSHPCRLAAERVGQVSVTVENCAVLPVEKCAV